MQLHHNIRHAVADYNAAMARLHQEMCTLSRFDIQAAFEANGYSGMRPNSARHIRTNQRQNGAQQFVYDCVWEGDDGEPPYHSPVYVWFDAGSIKADV